MNPFTGIPPSLPLTPETPATKQESDDKATSSFSMSDDDNESLSSVTVSSREKLALALSLKDEGTRKFKEQDLPGACATYMDGLRKLGRDSDTLISDEDTGDESAMISQEIRKARITLNLNVALCHVKLGQWIDAVHAASAVLKLEKDNVKALYRRGLARNRLGFLEEARDDLVAAVKYDPANTDARKELAFVKQRLVEARQRDKQNFGGLFAKAEGLYHDKAHAVEQQKQREEEQKRKEFLEFEEVNKAREAKGESTIESFEEWREQKVKADTSTPKKDNDIKPSTSTSIKTTSGASADLDEEDQKILSETKKMGYCYFNRPITEETVQQKPAPTRLEEATSTVSVEQQTEKTTKSLSSWNAAGTTYEERDCSSWFRDRVKEVFTHMQLKTSDVDFKVNSVSDVTGEAQVVVLRSSKRYLYDINFTLSWTLTLVSTEASPQKVDGKLILADVASTASSRSTNAAMSESDVFPDWLADAKLQVSSTSSLDTATTHFQEAILTVKREIFQSIKTVEEEFKARI